MDWGALADVLRSVHPGWTAAGTAVLLGEFLLRALRWRVLLRPVAPDARVRDLFSAQVVGAALNTLLPLRAGEVAKPLVAARRTGAPVAAVVATSVLERAYDLVGLVFVLVLMVVVLPDRDGVEGELVWRLKLCGALLGAAGLAGLAALFALARRPALADRVAAVLARPLPPAIRDRPGGLLRRFLDGLGHLEDPRARASALLLSLWLWLDGAVAIWFLFRAFDMALPFGAACFAGVAIALTVALPQAPGFVGVFHVAMEKTLVLWGEPSLDAKGFAIVFWAASFLPVTLLGLLAAWREGLRPANLRAGAPTTDGA